MPLPLVLHTVGSSSVAPPGALTAGEEAVVPADTVADEVAVAVGRDKTEQQVTSVMEMGIREHRDRIRLAVALLVLGIVPYAIVAEDTTAAPSKIPTRRNGGGPVSTTLARGVNYSISVHPSAKLGRNYHYHYYTAFPGHPTRQDPGILRK